MRVKPVIVHVEDENDWRHAVQDDVVQLGRLDFYSWVSVPTLEEARKEIGSISHPIVLIMDLKLEDEEPSFSGIHWLLEELEDLRSSHKIEVFVLSGYVDKMTVEILTRRGIPRHHIYDKFYWVEQRRRFIEAIMEANDILCSTPRARKQLFISYSHKDEKWLKRLQVHLKPLERLGTVVRWDDTMIMPGTKWREEIQKAVASAKVVVLLISADFFASDFITTNELPPLLAAAEMEGAVILPIIVSPSWFEQTASLARFQAVNPPSKPLVNMNKGAQEKVFVKAIQAIERVFRS